MRSLTLPKIVSAILVLALTLIGLSLPPIAAADSLSTCPQGLDLPGYDSYSGYDPQSSTSTPTEGPNEAYNYKPIDDDARNLPANSDELDDDALNKLAQRLGNTKPESGSKDHMLLRWRDYKNGADPKYDFERWRTAYITILENNRIGAAFEKFIWDKLALGEGTNEGNWKRNAKLPGSVLKNSPRYDITNTYAATRKPKVDARIPPVGDRQIIEAKSGNTLSDHAKKQFLKNLDLMNQADARMIMLFGSTPTAETLAWMKKAIDEWKTNPDNANKTAPEICVRHVNSLPVGQSANSSGNSPSPAGVPTTDQSPDNPADAAEDQRIADTLNAEQDAKLEETAAAEGEETTPAETPAPTTEPDLTPVTTQAPKPTSQPRATPTGGSPTGGVPTGSPAGTPAGTPAGAPAAAPSGAPATAPGYNAPVGAPATIPVVGTVPVNLGGIDFTSLQLRYVTANVDGKTGTQYAFQTGTLANDAPSYGGRRNATMAMDALNVWLALTPDKFWVNLKPTEPDRIIDADFGRTQAGRILLEADLAMKEVSGALQKSDTELGRNFMNALGGENKCFLGRRQWIEPLPASIHVDGDQLYILDAPLTVKLGHDDSDISPGQSCPGQDPAVTTHNGELYDQMIMPAVVKAVNNDPEFADLRRVYASRVAAEWYRTRNKPSQYSAQINSGKIDSWVMDWKPREVFDRYVTSFNNGTTTFTWTTQEGNTTWTHTRSWGGVDFSKVEMTDVGAEKFTQDYPQMAHNAAASLSTIVENNNQVWLGSATITGDPQQLWPMVRTPWTAFLVPTPAPARVIFYLAVITPVAVWGAVGVGFAWRRRRAGKAV